MPIVCASVLLASAVSGCYVRKETVREPTSSTTVERHTTVETAPEVRTRTTVEHDY
jgi:hypothetical protein